MCNIVRVAAPYYPETQQEEVEHSNVEKLTAYPNPANDEVTIALPSTVKVDRQVLVYDMFCKVSGTATIKKGEWKTGISTKEMAEGLYLINVSHGDWINATKMMVLHK